MVSANKKEKIVSFLLFMILRRKRRLKRQNKTIWVKPWILRRETQGAFSNLVQELGQEDPEGYRSYFEGKLYGCSLVEPDIRKQNIVMRERLLPAQRLSITVRFLTTGETFRSLHFAYRCGESTVSEVVLATCEAMYNNMKGISIHQIQPKGGIVLPMSFKKNYPFCLGAIDGKHIAIKPPPNSGSVCFNYKHFFSIVLLAVVDANYKFLYVDVGAPGRSGDAGVYLNSALKQALDANRLELPDEDESDEESHFHTGSLRETSRFSTTGCYELEEWWKMLLGS